MGNIRKMLPRQRAKLIVAGFGVAAVAAKVYQNMKKGEGGSAGDGKPQYEQCPTCGNIIKYESTNCTYCHASIKRCRSCGSLFNYHARFCPHCGMENDDGGTVCWKGSSYKGPVNEPCPQNYVSYTYCSCGTPFAENARYCMLCGTLRPKPGQQYLRKGSVKGNEKDEFYENGD